MIQSLKIDEFNINTSYFSFFWRLPDDTALIYPKILRPVFLQLGIHLSFFKVYFQYFGTFLHHIESQL